jgi:hypothetical protein
MTQAPAKSNHRRWLQFRLRTLLIVLAVAAVALGWEVNRVRNLRAVVTELEGKGAYVFYRPRSALIPTNWNHPDWLDYYLSDADEVTGISSDDAMKIVAKLPNLSRLKVEGPGFTDVGMERLSTITSLQNLQLDKVEITDAGLAGLVTLKNLAVLSITAPRITDGAFVHLSRLSNLTEIQLKSRHICDGGLWYLEDMTNLQRIELLDTLVSQDGEDRLRRVLSHCYVHITVW